MSAVHTCAGERHLDVQDHWAFNSDGPMPSQKAQKDLLLILISCSTQDASTGWALSCALSDLDIDVRIDEWATEPTCGLDGLVTTGDTVVLLWSANAAHASKATATWKHELRKHVAAEGLRFVPIALDSSPLPVIVSANSGLSMRSPLHIHGIAGRLAACPTRSVTQALESWLDHVEQMYNAAETIEPAPELSTYEAWSAFFGSARPGQASLILGEQDLRTALLLTFADDLAHADGPPTLVHSSNLNDMDLIARLIAIRGDIETARLDTGRLTSHDWSSIVEVVGSLPGSDLHFASSDSKNLQGLIDNLHQISGDPRTKPTPDEHPSLIVLIDAGPRLATGIGELLRQLQPHLSELGAQAFIGVDPQRYDPTAAEMTNYVVSVASMETDGVNTNFLASLESGASENSGPLGLSHDNRSGRVFTAE